MPTSSTYPAGSPNRMCLSSIRNVWNVSTLLLLSRGFIPNSIG